MIFYRHRRDHVVPGPRRNRRRPPVAPWIEALPDLPVKSMRELLGERVFQEWEAFCDRTDAEPRPAAGPATNRGVRFV
jgi:hypothetical protein